jgi:hypothetical protein
VLGLGFLAIHNAAGWAAVAAWATFLVLLATLVYVARQVREQFRPWVTVSFHFRSIIAFIEVQNLGNTPARNLRIRFEPELVSTLDNDFGQVAMLNDVTPVLVPGEHRLILLDKVPDRLKSDLPRRHTAYIEYSNHRGRKLPTEQFVLDFGLLDGANLPDRGMHDLVQAVSAVGKRLG